MSPGIVGESDLSGNLQFEYVFFDGERVARKDLPGNAVSYYFSDHLKTASVITDSAGNIKVDEDYYPWGGELQFVNNDSNHYKFTGKERDSETGLDYFGARYYGNWLGRFMSPDWAEKPEPVPYADLDDPQSLNLYSYVRNVPTVRVDLDGHGCPGCPTVAPAAEPTAEQIQQALDSVERAARLTEEVEEVKEVDNAPVLIGIALGLEVESFLEAHANRQMADATNQLIHEHNLNQVPINKKKQQQAQPKPQTPPVQKAAKDEEDTRRPPPEPKPERKNTKKGKKRYDDHTAPRPGRHKTKDRLNPKWKSWKRSKKGDPSR